MGTSVSGTIIVIGIILLLLGVFRKIKRLILIGIIVAVIASVGFGVDISGILSTAK